MTNRERWLKTMRFEPVDHPPLVLDGPWATTRKRWEAEGLPPGADLYDYFDLEPCGQRPVAIETMWHPPFEETLLEDRGEYVIKIDRRGVKVKNYKEETSMAEHLEYPIKGPESLSMIRERMNPGDPGRVDPDWLAKAVADREAGRLLFCNGGMYFAFLNEHMGTEHLVYAYYDEPDFVHAVNDRVCACCASALETCLPAFDLDLLAYHEDMAFKNGPLIGPDLFREFMTPYYKRISAIGDRHGIDLRHMDSDGDIRLLIPLWLEVGINIVSPNEVAAGMDVAALREEYGHALRMTGGVDKRILAESPDAIDRELDRLRPVIESGGYIPGCDHSVPPDVPWAHYRHYVERLKAMYGI